MLLPEQVSPDVYDVLLENEDVKILNVSFPPGKGDNMHDHYPFTFYVVDGGKLEVTLPDGKVNEMEAGDGFSGHNEKGVRHRVKNIGEKPVNIILVEHKNLASTKLLEVEKTLAPENVSPDIYKVLFENDELKAVEATFPAGESDLMHEHGAYAAYIIEGGEVQMINPDGTSLNRNFPDGATAFSSNVQRHQVKNIGDSDIRVFMVEYK
tara:strand:+ start:7051 stop:7677 length:627 start_codon:yes stop_codon:yes gene_type:complete